MKKTKKLAKYVKRYEHAGKPPLFDNEEKLANLIAEYFKSCQDADNPGKLLRPYTMTGLALALGMDRLTLIAYGKKEKFHNTIKKARSIVEQFNEERLHSSNSAGVMFNLTNNFGWKNPKYAEHNNQTKEYDETLAKINKIINDKGGKGE